MGCCKTTRLLVVRTDKKAFFFSLVFCTAGHIDDQSVGMKCSNWNLTEFNPVRLLLIPWKAPKNWRYPLRSCELDTTFSTLVDIEESKLKEFFFFFAVFQLAAFCRNKLQCWWSCDAACLIDRRIEWHFVIICAGVSVWCLAEWSCGSSASCFDVHCCDKSMVLRF